MGKEGNDGQTFTVAGVDKDGTLLVKDEKGAEVRFVKEEHLLAIKGSKESAEQRVKELEKAGDAGGAAAKAELESTRQKVLQAEATIASLEAKIASSATTAAELTKAKAELVTAKKSGEEQGNKLLELQRTLIVGTYGVPKATVDGKSMEQLQQYAEALAAVTGKQLGNYAAGGGSGGADLSGKSPMELARMAYENKQ